MATSEKIKLEGASQYKKELQSLTQANKTLAAEMKEVKSSFDSTTSSEEKHERLTAQLNKQIANQAKYIDTLNNALKEEEAAHGTTSQAYMKTEEALHKAQAAMNDMQHDLNNLTKEEDKNIPSALEMSAAFDTLSEMTSKAMGAIQDCTRAAIEFESSMAAVSRTTGLEGEALNQMAENFEEMSTTMPVSANELARIATTAGQLGIAQDDVLTFSETIAKLSVVAQMSADEVATSMAQIANITGDTDFAAMADTIAVMGDATATTAARILDMSLGLAAAGTNAGMTSDNILALSAAVSSTGVQAQAGGTAMSRLIQQMNMAVATGENLNAWAEMAGMSAAEFKVAWGNDATDVLLKFIQGLDATAESGKSLDKALSDLGVSSVRELTTVKNLASDSEKLATALEMANNAYKNGTGLSQKYGIMASTTEAQTQMCANAMERLKVSVGDALAPALGSAAEAGTDVFNALANITEECPGLVRAFTGFITATSAAITLPALFGKITAAVSALSGALGVSGAGGLLAAAGPIGILAAVITAVAGACFDFNNEINKMADSMALTTTSTAEAEAELAKMEARYKELDNIWAEYRTQEETKEMEALARAIPEAKAALDEMYTATINEAQALAEQEAYLQSAPGQLEVLTANLQELAVQYQETYDASMKSLEGQFKLFEKVKSVAITSTDDILAGLKSQADYYNSYADNLNLLESLTGETTGLSEELVNSLNDGSAESVAATASLVAGWEEAKTKGSEAQKAYIDSINTAFEEQQTAMSNAAEAMAESQTEFSETWDSMVKDTAENVAAMDKGTEAYTSGKNTVQGLINGYESLRAQVKQKGIDIANAFNEGYNSVEKMGSPSKTMTQWGKWTAEGLIVGIDSMRSDAANSMANLATAMNSGLAAGRSVSNTVNINATQVSESTIDYIYNRLNRRMGMA